MLSARKVVKVCSDLELDNGASCGPLYVPAYVLSSIRGPLPSYEIIRIQRNGIVNATGDMLPICMTKSPPF